MAVQVGFFGIEKYEILLYLSRIIKQLGKSVLLVDYSENGALSAGIPVWEKYGEYGEYGTAMVAENEEYKTAVDYCGIHFMRNLALNEEVRKQYDCVLIDFGFELFHDAAVRCSKIVYVADQQLHNLKRLRDHDSWPQAETYAVLKDLCPCRITPEYILSEIRLTLPEERQYAIYQDIWDLKCRISCQYSKLSPFVRLSRECRDFLKDFTGAIFPEFGRAAVDRAFRAAEKGV